eukprot:1024478-Karenia_brevis.AAC.1
MPLGLHSRSSQTPGVMRLYPGLEHSLDDASLLARLSLPLSTCPHASLKTTCIVMSQVTRVLRAMKL